MIRSGLRNPHPGRHAAVWSGWILAFACADAAATHSAFGPYISIQVNVDAAGQNITGDAANEPTMAINPLDPGNIVIAWRQFDSVQSSFRQGSWAHSQDGGSSWTFPGSLTPGQGRSNPVIDVDAQGNFYFQSLRFDEQGIYIEDIQVIKSTDGGRSWQEPVFAHGRGGDKGQIAVDRSGGIGDGHVYVNWRETGDDYCFTRSIDGGASFELPVGIPGNPSFGTMAVGPEGELYIAGRLEPSEWDEETQNRNHYQHIFSKSLDARDPDSIPTFTTQILDIGGPAPLFNFRNNPNRYGPIGDVQVDVDRSNGPLRGKVYVLATVDPPGEDNLDIKFVRSSDGGETWSAPIRVNDDEPNKDSWQWFGMMGVAPNSRIDAVWYDTRDSGSYNVSRLYYAYSWDGGATWSKNVPVSQPFDTTIGYPHASQKMGDYSTLVSRRDGASVAYTATFNGEQDVYYLNVFPDCNENGVSDVLDIEQGRAGDADADHIPDSCETTPLAGDLDGDGDIDRLDIDLILAVRNQSASGPDDPRDIDKNGTIDALDARKLTLSCTRPRCAAE